MMEAASPCEPSVNFYQSTRHKFVGIYSVLNKLWVQIMAHMFLKILQPRTVMLVQNNYYVIKSFEPITMVRQSKVFTVTTTHTLAC